MPIDSVSVRRNAMLGRCGTDQCVPSSGGDAERYKRDIFTDMKIAIDCLRDLDDKLKVLDPDVSYKVRQIIYGKMKVHVTDRGEYIVLLPCGVCKELGMV
jgi:hypothetical protein